MKLAEALIDISRPAAAAEELDKFFPAPLIGDDFRLGDCHERLCEAVQGNPKMSPSATRAGYRT